MTFVQTIIATLYLYYLLNWSAFVGLVAIIALAPVPVYLGKLITGIQQERMRASDKRVQAVTEYTSIIRMLKLFAWEPYALGKIEMARDEELREMRKGRLVAAVLKIANELSQVVARLIVLSVYVCLLAVSATPDASDTMPLQILFSHQEFRG